MTAGGKGDSARRRELLLVVALWRIIGFTVGGVITSNCSSSDLSNPSRVNVGVLGEGEALLGMDSASDIVAILSHGRGVSGDMVISDTSRELRVRFGNTISSCG